MTRLLIGNDTPKVVLEYNADFSEDCALWAMLILWHIKDDDIILLPLEPDPGHLEYIAELTGTSYKSLQVIVAPKGAEISLSADRITNENILATLNRLLVGRKLEAIVPISIDVAVAKLARSLKADKVLPGTDFASQGGGMLANSKVVFRAIAAGISLAIPMGCVTNHPKEAEDFITNMLFTEGVPVIVKKDFAQGCKGNEILSHTGGLPINGGRRGWVLENCDAVKTYIAENWRWLTNGGRNSFVIERYFPDSVAIFAEFNLSDQGVDFLGVGEMQAVPIADAEVIPPVDVSLTAIAKIVDGGRRLSLALHGIGYRGILSTDAMITPDGSVLFSEYNGRITGSTHIYSTIGARVVGENWMQNRILVERRGWKVPSFQAAKGMLEECGLAYNHDTKVGIILSGSFGFPRRGMISITTVAENLAQALSFEEKLYRKFPRISLTSA